MKQIIILLIALIIVVGAIGYRLGYTVRGYKEPEKIQILQIENAFLRDYKKAYMDHIDKCDTLHQKCFRTK